MCDCNYEERKQQPSLAEDEIVRRFVAAFDRFHGESDHSGPAWFELLEARERLEAVLED